MTTHFQPTPTYGDERYQPEDGPAPPQRNGGPPRRTLADAVRRFWVLALLPVLVLGAAGVYAGRSKPPTYSAMATINVGKSDIATQATPGYLVAAEALASSYSRLVTSQNVAVPAAKAVGESPAKAASSLTAVPIPNEPTFTISATGSSSAQATALANAAVQALNRNVATSATQQGGPSQLLAKYRAAQARSVTLQATASRLQGKLSAQQSGVSTTGHVSQAQVTKAKVAAQTATLQAQALSQQYLNLSQSGVAPTLQVLDSPTGATSTNRRTNMEKYGVIGAVAGLVIGIAFAALLEGVAVTRRRVA